LWFFWKVVELIGVVVVVVKSEGQLSFVRRRRRRKWRLPRLPFSPARCIGILLLLASSNKRIDATASSSSSSATQQLRSS
jgi:hypothetical protein